MSKKFTYKGKEYDFYYTADDEAVVERYDTAERAKNGCIEAIKVSRTIPIGKVEENRAVCIALTDFIDDVLGDGTCNAAFGEKTTPTEILKLANTLVMYVAGRMSEENTAVEETPLNRAQRRAKK